jgi:hypothetical protein
MISYPREKVAVRGLVGRISFGWRLLQACWLFQINFSLFKFIFLVVNSIAKSILIVKLNDKILIV